MIPDKGTIRVLFMMIYPQPVYYYSYFYDSVRDSALFSGIINKCSLWLCRLSRVVWVRDMHHINRFSLGDLQRKQLLVGRSALSPSLKKLRSCNISWSRIWRAFFYACQNIWLNSLHPLRERNGSMLLKEKQFIHLYNHQDSFFWSAENVGQHCKQMVLLSWGKLLLLSYYDRLGVML